jgi:poly(A)-specific ribonuclease
MDVDNVAFLPRLLPILEAMSKCHFVSFDLELSGVTSRPSGPRSKQTLQRRYTETKEAAERYQILQMGITFAVQDDNKEVYTLQPYNFPISPIFEEDLDIERIFSFQSGAVEFLLRNSFDIAGPFTHGVSYLSRDEEKLAKQKMKERDDKSRFTNLELNKDDVQAREFMQKIRTETNAWLKTGEPEFHQIAIVSSYLLYFLCHFDLKWHLLNGFEPLNIMGNHSRLIIAISRWLKLKSYYAICLNIPTVSATNIGVDITRDSFT